MAKEISDDADKQKKLEYIHSCITYDVCKVNFILSFLEGVFQGSLEEIFLIIPLIIELSPTKSALSSLNHGGGSATWWPF